MIEALVAEGERMSRPSVLLRADGAGEIGAYWGGERADEPNAVPPSATAIESIRHVITFDARLLSSLGVPVKSPALAMFETTTKTGQVMYRVASRNGIQASDFRGDFVPLHASRARSFPPIEAVCLYGGDVVTSWLKRHGLKRLQYFDASELPEAREYTDEYMRRCPLYLGNADAILGGWHQRWPEDDFYLPLEMRLALWTLRDAEPWLEVFFSLAGGGVSVRSRNT